MKRKQVLQQVLQFLEGKGLYEVDLDAIERAVPIPRMLDESMKVLLRQYPDVVTLFADSHTLRTYVHATRLEITADPRDSDDVVTPQLEVKEL